MHRTIVNLILLAGLFFGLIVLVSGMNEWRLPDNQQGYAPKQQIDVEHPLYESFAQQYPEHPSIVAKKPLPISYSHRLHAGELEIDCRFCHTAAEKSRHAGIPSSDVCMKCHKFVTTSFSVFQDELRKLDAKKAEAEKNGGRRSEVLLLGDVPSGVEIDPQCACAEDLHAANCSIP